MWVLVVSNAGSKVSKPPAEVADLARVPSAEDERGNPTLRKRCTAVARLAFKFAFFGAHRPEEFWGRKSL